MRACRPRVGAPLAVSALLLVLVPGAHAAKGYGGAPSSPTGGVGLELRREVSEAGVMNFLASVLIALLAWALLSWVSGIALGCIIDLMEGEDEFDDPRWRLPAEDRRLFKK